MRVGIIQSSYIPWRGYFDFIASVDVFVFHDDIQYTKNDWRNRNRIKTPKGIEWLTVPVNYKKTDQLICETSIDFSTLWHKKHLRKLEENYRKTSHIKAALDIFSSIQADSYKTINHLNIALIKRICNYLYIPTKLISSSDLSVSGTKTDRLINILEKLGASTYLSGPSADAYLNKKSFAEKCIRLEYKSYDYAPYPQLWGNFQGEVTILDLIANCGPDAKNYLHSQSPNRVIS